MTLWLTRLIIPRCTFVQVSDVFPEQSYLSCATSYMLDNLPLMRETSPRFAAENYNTFFNQFLLYFFLFKQEK